MQPGAYNSTVRYENANGWNHQTSPRAPNDVPAVVKSLLASTKQLQESLRLWSIRQASEAEVSDTYVRVGTEFNSTIQAFAYYSIDLSDIYSVPKDLRAVLESCLGEDPSPQTYSQYVPRVRQILYSLLRGLHSKQPAYWRAVGRAQPFLPSEPYY